MPHGFHNGRFGLGHLNADGYRAIANVAPAVPDGSGASRSLQSAIQTTPSRDPSGTAGATRGPAFGFVTGGRLSPDPASGEAGYLDVVSGSAGDCCEPPLERLEQ